MGRYQDAYAGILLPSLLTDFATQVIRKLDSSSDSACPVISFGYLLCDHANMWSHSEDDRQRYVHYKPTAYLPRLRKDLYGRDERYTIAIDATELKYIEPECEVVQYALGQSL